MIPEFEKVAFAMKENQTSDIVKTKFGFHIIKVTGKRPAGERSFDDVKEQMRKAQEAGLLLTEDQRTRYQELEAAAAKQVAAFIIRSMIPSPGI